MTDIKISSAEGIESLLDKLNPDKASGPDQLKHIVLQTLDKAISQTNFLIYSTGIAMLLSNVMRRVFPRRYRDGHVTFCCGCSEDIARTRRGIRAGTSRESGCRDAWQVYLTCFVAEKIKLSRLTDSVLRTCLHLHGVPVCTKYTNAEIKWRWINGLLQS